MNAVNYAMPLPQRPASHLITLASPAFSYAPAPAATLPLPRHAYSSAIDTRAAVIRPHLSRWADRPLSAIGLHFTPLAAMGTLDCQAERHRRRF